MPPVLKLRNLLHCRNQAQSILPSPFLLPLEMWELVLEELTEEWLRTAARVCSAFNDRCIAIYLRRHEINPESLAIGTLHIYSPLLSILQLSRLTPQIHTLVCHFWAYRVLRDMKYLRQFVQRLHGIKELQLFFAGNLINAHTVDTIFPYSQTTLLAELCDVVRAVVWKSPGPIIVIIDGTIYRVRPRDLAGWGSRYFFYWKHRFGRIAWIDKARFLLKSEEPEPHLFLPVWSPGRGQKPEYTRYLNSINIRGIPARSGADEPFTFLVLNGVTTEWLELGPTSFISEAAIPSSQLTGILPHLTLPSLHSLNIHQDLDPATLHQFLVRHPSIQFFHYKVKEPTPALGRSPDKEHKAPLLTSSPIALPSLETLSCEDPIYIIPLLDTFGSSPQLQWIDIGFVRYSAPQVASLKRALRRISLRTPPTSLHISTLFNSGMQWPIDEEERNIVGCLYSITRVRLRGENFPEVQSLLPWLGMLPALAHLEISTWDLRDLDTDAAARDSAIQVARAALPWVPRIDILRW
ncbi:hypothetical protein B0H17DRAFT_1329985 [Mycena rosella]|uniref:F-box domain-containing protein n=1 Tax=Mycena rosella TaxID=1033263 RepID=A0AAD7DL52_MYCRO|nr:hypothetical protein B0H17DRAFT_1329985 [Mycena rosella]